MSIYKGRFLITNNTGYNMLGATAKHSASGASSVTIGPYDLKNSESSDSTSFDTDETSKDHWHISFRNQAGDLVIGTTTCGFEKSDQTTIPVSIECHAGHFDVEMPESSSCNDIDYEGIPRKS